MNSGMICCTGDTCAHRLQIVRTSHPIVSCTSFSRSAKFSRSISDTSHERLDPLSVFFCPLCNFCFFSSCLTDVALCACNFCVCAQPPQYSPGIRVVCSGSAISVFSASQDHVVNLGKLFSHEIK